MNLDWIKVLPSKETPFNKEFFEKLATSILDYALPVGKTEIFYDAEDHSNYLGFKWERTSLERSPIGYNPDSTDSNYKTIGNKFGEKEHKLTADEMPSHTHQLRAGAKTNAWNSPNGTLSYQYQAEDVIVSNEWTVSNGGSKSHNTIHPVEVVAFWKRVE